MRPISATENIPLALPSLVLIKQTPENTIFLYGQHFTAASLQMLHSLNHRDDLFISSYFDVLKSVHTRALL